MAQNFLKLKLPTDVIKNCINPFLGPSEKEVKDNFHGVLCSISYLSDESNSYIDFDFKHGISGIDIFRYSCDVTDCFNYLSDELRNKIYYRFKYKSTYEIDYN